MKLNKRIKYLHIRIKNGVRQTHTAYRELSESEVKRVPNRYWVDDLPKPMKRIKKEVEKKKHIHRYKVYGSTAVCKCGQIKVKSSPKPTKIEKLIEEIEIRGITITMEDISYFPCIESGTWKRFKKEINNLLSH